MFAATVRISSVIYIGWIIFGLIRYRDESVSSPAVWWMTGFWVLTFVVPVSATVAVFQEHRHR